ncbi:MAG TPA: TIGR04222 domain-containing membrane protein [Polyangia bacterium]|jgi:uncharacterized protein (TIGR04222 family)
MNNLTNALDLRGPEFLTWYLQWFALAAIACLALRWLLRRPPAAHAPPHRELEPFEIAWLQGGPPGVVRAALASLYQRKLIDMRDGVITWRAPAPAAPLSEIEDLVFRGAWLGFGSSDLKIAVEDECAEIEARLAGEGLAVGPGQRAALRLIPSLAMLVCFATGVAKLLLGIERHRPIGVLVFLLLLSALALVCAVRFIPRATTAGTRLLHDLADRHAALRTTLESSAAESLGPSDVAMAVGIWGPAVLSAPLLASVLEPRKARTAGDGAGGSCGEGGGGSSCGGGGGCGGGGCGGCGG